MWKNATKWGQTPFILLLAQVAGGQAPTARPAFETADVHISAPGTGERCGFLPEGRFECRGETMLRLIATAYSVTPDLVVGGSNWLASDRFDIAAKAPSRKASPAVLRAMLQTLLEDRFGLAVHDEQRDIPVYLLKVAKSGSKLRSAANPSARDCPSVDGDPNLNHRDCRAYSMADLATLLPLVAQNYADHPVLDATDLRGVYDFRLEWMSKDTYLASKADPNAPQAVSMFDALEKLGLKLEPATRPTPVIAVDHVNPTPAGGTTSTAPEFEVADIRPSKHPTQQEGLNALKDGQLEIMSYTLRDLIALAFEVKADKLTGGPKWLDSDRFDVIAKSPDVMSPHAMSAMLKTLIVQRFKLQTHTEDQPVPVFALVLGKSAPNLRETSGSPRSECNLRLADQGRMYVCRNTTMAQLADRLPNVAQAYFTRPLVDLTGLKGAYDITLTWTPRDARRRTPASLNLTVFEAIEKQLGVRIDERKHLMPVIVIDHAEKNI